MGGLENQSLARFIDSCWFLRNPQWLNATYSMGKVQKDVQNTVSKVLKDIEVLSKTLTDQNCKLIALGTYRESGDVSKTIEVYNEILEERKVISKAIGDDAEKEPPKTEEPKTPMGEIVYTYHFDVNMTEEQFGKLIEWFKKNSIHGQMRGKERFNAEH